MALAVPDLTGYWTDDLSDYDWSPTRGDWDVGGWGGTRGGRRGGDWDVSGWGGNRGGRRNRGRGAGGGTTSDVDVYRPRTDVLDRGNEVDIFAEVPGMSREDVHVNVENNRLIISGETKQEREYRRDNTRRTTRERIFARFHRTFRVPEGVNCDNIRARIENGVLRVTYPKQDGGGRQVRVD